MIVNQIFPFFFFIKFIANTHGFAVESEIINLKFIVTLNDKKITKDNI